MESFTDKLFSTSRCDWEPKNTSTFLCHTLTYEMEKQNNYESSLCTNQPGKTNILQHTIYTTNCVPIRQRPY